MLIQETKEGLERQFGINHIGHFLLTTSLLDLMGEGSRMVVVASVADVSGEYFYKCKIAKSSKRSKDMELAKELFEFSSKLINNKA